MHLILVGLLMFIGSLIVFLVGYPLFSKRHYQLAGQVLHSIGQFENLFGERDRILSTLRDLQVEHLSGILSDTDYQLLRSNYDVKAGAILQQLDALNKK